MQIEIISINQSLFKSGKSKYTKTYTQAHTHACIKHNYNIQ